MQAPTAFELLVGNLQAIGLFYDLAGILILGISVVSKWTDVISQQSGTSWDYNASLAEALSASKLDALIGTILLALGFGFQLAAQMGCSATSTLGLLLLCSLILVAVLYGFWLRRVIVNRLTSRIRARHEQQGSESRTTNSSRTDGQ